MPLSALSSVNRPRGTRAWILTTLGTGLVVILALIALHSWQVERSVEGSRVARELSQADLDVMDAYLTFKQAQDVGDAAQRESALTTLRTALDRFDRAVQTAGPRVRRAQPLLRVLESEPSQMKLLLGAAWDRSDRMAQAALRESFHRLQREFSALDAVDRAELLRQVQQDDATYRRAILAGVALFVIMAAVLVRALRFEQQATRRISENEAHLRGVVEQSMVGIRLIQDGRIVYANARAAEIFGLSAEQMVGRDPLEFVAPDLRAAGAANIDRIQRGDEPLGLVSRYVYVRHDGRRVVYQAQGRQTQLNGRPALVSILVDVTDVETTLQEKESALDLLQMISNSSENAIYAKDLAGRYLLFNAGAEQLTGKTAPVALEHRVTDVFSDTDMVAIREVDREILRTGRSVTLEQDIRRADGTQLTLLTTKGPLINKAGEIFGIFGISRDITERKAQVTALRAGQRQIETVLDSLSEGIMIFAPDARLLRMNPAARGMFGIERDAVLPDTLASFVKPYLTETIDGQPMVVGTRPIERALRGEDVEAEIVVVRQPDAGWTHILSVTGRVVRGESGAIDVVVMTFTDVTERIRMEEGLRQSQRLESLGTLAAGIAHDFNNILLSIAGNTRLLAGEGSQAGEREDVLGEIQRAAERASDLVRRILLFARAEPPRRDLTSLSAVVLDALRMVRPAVPASVVIDTQVGSDLMLVEADASQIHQVVVNLITNATHAIANNPSAREGRIQVGVASSEVSGTLRLAAGHTLRPGRYLLLTVSDNGHGMDAQTLERAFDPFFTTKPVGEGTGMGLAVVHGIIQEHGGAIAVDSTVGQGTRIGIYLPAVASRAGSASVAAPADLSVAGQGRRVMYVDDEESLALLVTRYLRRLGFEVTAYTRSEDALQALRAAPGDFDVIVSDLSMPKLSGFDLVREARLIRKDLPAIVVSGYIRPEDRQHAQEVGVNELLLKASTVDDFAHAIARVVA